MPSLISIKTFLFRNEILLLLVLNFDTHILLKYSYEPNRMRIVLVISELENRRYVTRSAADKCFFPGKYFKI